MRHIGFSGTRKGMTREQKDALFNMWVVGKTPTTLHHGDCIGSDETADDLAAMLEWEVHIHPPILAKHRAFCSGAKIEPPKDYLERNRDIVHASSTLFATPTMSQKGGTWYTIRYAKEYGIGVIMILPNGTINVFN